MESKKTTVIVTNTFATVLTKITSETKCWTLEHVCKQSQVSNSFLWEAYLDILKIKANQIIAILYE